MSGTLTVTPIGLEIFTSVGHSHSDRATLEIFTSVGHSHSDRGNLEKISTIFGLSHSDTLSKKFYFFASMGP